MGAVESKAQERGVKAFEVVEYNTSEYCVSTAQKSREEGEERSAVPWSINCAPT